MELNLQYQQEFREIDKNSSGLISKSEFMKYYKLHGELAGSSESFLEWMFAVIDEDNSEKISFKEFCIFAEAKSMIDFTDERWFERMIFRMMDTDKSGAIDADEFKRLLVLLGLPSGKDDLKELIDAIDADGNGVIDMDEFINFLSQN